MPIPVAAAALGKVGGASAKADSALNPEDAFMGNNKELIIVLMVGAAAIIFVQHARSGQPQNGKQYIAVGIVGFALLLLAEFAPEVAFAFALLFVIGVILNSPNGVPLLASAQAKKG